MSSFGLLRANLHRHPVRTYLTLLSVLVAFLLFGLLRTLAVWFGSGPAEGASVDRLVVSAKYSIIDMLPISQMNAIVGVDGVEAVTHQSWFGGNYQDGRSFFPKFPVEPRSYFAMFPELRIDPAHLDAFERTRTGAVVPESMLADFGWQLGDKIPIEADIWPMADGNRIWVFDLVGTYTTDSEGQGGVFLFHYDFFEEARGFARGTVGWYTVRIEDPDRAAEVANAIDATFENSTNPTKTATEDEFGKAFAAQIGDLGLMATGILSAVFFTVLLLTANTMTQALRERIPELAVLKTLGFGNARVAWLVLGESVLLCVVGGALGIGLAALFTPVATAFLPQFGPSALAFAWQTAATGVGVAIGLGVVVGAVPAMNAGRLSIAEALRRS
ncbi:MAG: FtsX-like permease family protein [Gammaproteobacteria bacterium]|nr:FtsX-like permease family protein [Gammaproteobacteria bacterium]